MTELTKEYLEYKKKVERKRKSVDKAEKELHELLDQCPHEEIESKSKYFTGGYNYKAQTNYWNECKLCNACSDTIVETHDYYG